MVLIISVIVIVVSLNSGDKGQKPGTEQTQEQTNEAVSSQGKKDETEIIGDDTPFTGKNDTDKAGTDKADVNKTEDKGSGEQQGSEEQFGSEEQLGSEDQQGSEDQPGSEEQPEKSIELPFVPYS